MFKMFLSCISASLLFASFNAQAEEGQEDAVVFEQEIEKDQVEQQEETSSAETLDQELNLSMDDQEDDEDDDPENDEYLDLKRLA